MALFELPFALPDPGPGVPVLRTPRGPFRLHASFGGDPLPLLPHTRYAQPAASARLLGWRTPALQAEVLVCRPSLALPDGMRVDGCLAAMWRVRAMREVGPCSFACLWQERQGWIEQGSESGEGLDAYTWGDGEVRISAGTEDGEALLHRAGRGRELPLRWADPAVLGCADPQCADRSHAAPDGLRIALPELRPGELCQVHFAVAWAPDRPGDESTWLAVELSPAQILAGAHAA